MITDQGKQHIPIFMYHSISNYASPSFRPCIVEPEAFEEHLFYLEQHHFTPVTVTQFAQAIARRGEGLPRRPVILTFDDGYADFYTHAFPALHRHGFTATLYVATGFVGGTSRWLQHIGEGKRPMVTWEQLKEMNEGGIECAAHSHNHRPLDMLSPSEARNEITRSKDLLEEHLGLPVLSFAYPFGYYSSWVRQIVQEVGFTSACAIKRSLSSLHDDLYALARLAIKPDTSLQAIDAALTVGRGPLVASPVKRSRGHIRQNLRSMYGKLTYNWNALYQVRR